MWIGGLALATVAAIMLHQRQRHGHLLAAQRAEVAALGYALTEEDLIGSDPADPDNRASHPALSLFEVDRRPHAPHGRMALQARLGRDPDELEIQLRAISSLQVTSLVAEPAAAMPVIDWDRVLDLQRNISARDRRGLYLADWPEEPDPAAGFLAAMEPLHADMRELAGVARSRPLSAGDTSLGNQGFFHCLWEDPLGGEGPHQWAMNGALSGFAILGMAGLDVGQPDFALDAAVASLGVARLIVNDPFRRDLSQAAKATTPVWYGLRQQLWSPSQLDILQQQLESILADLDPRRPVRGEVVRQLARHDQHVGDRLNRSRIRRSATERAYSTVEWNVRRWAADREIISMPWDHIDTPPRWMDASFAHTLAMVTTALPDGWESPWLDLEPDVAWSRIAPGLPHSTRSYPDVARRDFLQLHEVYNNTRTAIVRLRLARIALALERERSGSGDYPETLALWNHGRYGLSEDDLQDPFAAQLLRYRRTSEGRFVLYSIGLNRTDDGGRQASRWNKRSDAGHDGDIVWGYELPPGP